jgi:hypothetical protein
MVSPEFFGSFFSPDIEKITFNQLKRFRRTNPDFGSGNVLQQGYRPVKLFGYASRIFDQLCMKRMISMAEIKAKNINPQQYQSFNNGFIGCCRSRSCNYLRSSHM